nr:U4/U6.U5 tri-snRNP-associated protein 1-like [Anolis sagrei ordinatus]
MKLAATGSLKYSCGSVELRSRKTLLLGMHTLVLKHDHRLSSNTRDGLPSLCIARTQTWRALLSNVPRIRGRGRRKVSLEEEDEGGEERYGYARNGAAEEVPPSDDLRVERMEISSDEDDTFRGADSPTVLEEDEAEQELQKQLEKGRKLRQIQQLKDSGEKVIEIVKKLDTGRSQEDDEELEKKGAIVFNATSEFCRTLGEIPTYGLAGNREDQEELMDFERDDERSANGGSDSDGEENIGWSTVNLDEEKQQQDPGLLEEIYFSQPRLGWQLLTRGSALPVPHTAILEWLAGKGSAARYDAQV